MPDPINKLLLSDNWPKRRRLMYVVLLWAIVASSYILYLGRDLELDRTAFVMLISLIISIVGSYVFGAVWDDADKRKNIPADTTDKDPSA